MLGNGLFGKGSSCILPLHNYEHIHTNPLPIANPLPMFKVALIIMKYILHERAYSSHVLTLYLMFELLVKDILHEHTS